MVADATDGAYRASIRDVSFNILTRELTAEGLELWPDTSRPAPLTKPRNPFEIKIRLSVPKFRFEGVALMRLIFHHELLVEHVVIRDGRLLIISKPHTIDSSAVPDEKQAPLLKKLMAGTIDIINPDITFQRTGEGDDNLVCRLKGGNGIFKDWLLEPGQSDTSRLLFARLLVIDSSSFVYNQPSLYYLFKIPSFNFNSETQQLLVHNLSVHPFADRATFYRILGHRATIWNSTMKLIELEGFNWKDLIYQNTLRISAINFTEPRIDLYFNYLIPSKPQNMIEEDPPRLFHLLPLKVDIKKIDIRNGAVRYTELNEKSQREGILYVDDIRVHGTGLSNIDSVIATKNQFAFGASGTLLGKSKIKADVRLLLSDVSGKFDLEAHVKDIDAQQLRKPAEALDMIKVDSLKIHEMDLYMKGDQDHSQSKLRMIYSNLKVDILKPKDAPALTKRPLATFAANAFFIYKDNPESGKDLRTGGAYIKRDETAPYFSLIIKNLKTAMKETIIKHPGLVGTLTNDEELKSQKKGFFRRLFHRKGKNN